MEWTIRLEARTGWDEVSTFEGGSLHRRLGDVTMSPPTALASALRRPRRC